MIPSALHTVEQYADNQVETDHGRLKSRLRRGLKRRRSARILHLRTGDGLLYLATVID